MSFKVLLYISTSSSRPCIFSPVCCQHIIHVCWQIYRKLDKIVHSRPRYVIPVWCNNLRILVYPLKPLENTMWQIQTTLQVSRRGRKTHSLRVSVICLKSPTVGLNRIRCSLRSNCCKVNQDSVKWMFADTFQPSGWRICDCATLKMWPVYTSVRVWEGRSDWSQDNTGKISYNEWEDSWKQQESSQICFRCLSGGGRAWTMETFPEVSTASNTLMNCDKW